MSFWIRVRDLRFEVLRYYHVPLGSIAVGVGWCIARVVIMVESTVGLSDVEACWGSQVRGCELGVSRW
jgi:hypothetical protein